MMRALCLGAGGHARVVADAARLDPGVELVGLLDDDTLLQGTERSGLSVLGPIGDLSDLARERDADHAVVGIGGHRADAIRAELAQRVLDAGLALATVRHPSAVIAGSARIGPGVALLAGAVVNADASLGRNTILNTRAVVEHDAVIGDHTHVCPGAIVLGAAVVGRGSFVGAGAVVVQGVRVGEGVTIGAGAVVVRDVPDGATVAGVPAGPLG